MLLQRQIQQQQEITVKHLTTKAAENSMLLNDLSRLQRENRLLRKKVQNTKSDVEMLESNLRRVRQATREK
jgi:predicted RNase H-like nuclease (RuvC/YqgF family)